MNIQRLSAPILRLSRHTRPILRYRPAQLGGRRSFATPSTPDDLAQNIPAALIAKFQNSPKTLSQVQTLTKLFADKGIAMDKKPSMIDIFNMSRDAEIKDALRELKRVMDEENVTGDVMQAMSSMGMGMGDMGLGRKL